jgi:hypothetical protein
MKTRILAAVFSIGVFFASAQTRVMSHEEMSTLAESSAFEKKCKEAVLKFAVYWSVHPGTGFATEAECITWAKNRQLSIDILKNGGSSDTKLVLHYIIAGMNKQFTLGASPQSDTALITAWDSTNPNTFEQLSNDYFKLLGDNINFSIGN